MIIKNTAANRRLVDQLSDYMADKTLYFRSFIDLHWNLGKDIRFEISSVGDDSPLIIGTEYTTTGGFSFNVRLLQNKLEKPEDMTRLRFMLDDAETILMGIRQRVEDAYPALSKHV